MTEERVEAQDVEEQETEVVEAEVVEESTEQALIREIMQGYFKAHGLSPAMKILVNTTGLSSREINAAFESGNPYEASGVPNPPCYRG